MDCDFLLISDVEIEIDELVVRLVDEERAAKIVTPTGGLLWVVEVLRVVVTDAIRIGSKEGLAVPFGRGYVEGSLGDGVKVVLGLTEGSSRVRKGVALELDE